MWEQRPESNKAEVAGPEWKLLFDLAVVICLRVEGWKGPDPSHVDAGGFDWGVGIQNSANLYKKAGKVIERFGNEVS